VTGVDPDLRLQEDIERCFEGGWTDGLPVIPPYQRLIDDMLERMGWRPTDVIGEIADQNIEIRAEHLAATAVMAGCKPEYARLLRALSELLVEGRLNISGVEVTTGGVAALVVVSGPIVEELGFEHEANALGANCRANATVGRFAQMVRLFCGRGGGVLEPHGTMGHPGRLSYCIAEHRETTWAPFHTQFELPAKASAVTVMAAEGPNSVNNHYATTGRQVLESIADVIASYGSTNWYWRVAGYLVAVGPDHHELIVSEYGSREEVQRAVFELAVRPTDELIRIGRLPADPTPDREVEPGTMRSPMASSSQLHFVETGKTGGRFSAVIPRWVANSRVVSKVVE
jgi:hypothetical protein